MRIAERWGGLSGCPEQKWRESKLLNGVCGDNDCEQAASGEGARFKRHSSTNPQVAESSLSLRSLSVKPIKNSRHGLAVPIHSGDGDLRFLLVVFEAMDVTGTLKIHTFDGCCNSNTICASRAGTTLKERGFGLSLTPG